MPSAPPDARREVAEQLLDIVGGLVAELSGGPARRPSPQDSLDRDLGIGSLERVELLLRLERAFGVRLADSVMADAATPEDLVTAILEAAPAPLAPTSTAREPRGPAAPAAPAPTQARSLVDVLRWHADRSPDRVHLHLRTDEGAELEVTYGALAAAAAAVAGGLKELGVARGDRVALMLRTERAFFEAFFGALAIGAIPVPLYPPVRREDLVAYAERQQNILRNAGARVLVTFGEAERLAGIIRGEVPSLEAVVTAERLHRGGAPVGFERPLPDDPALIQYTSGSTGSPKGVLLSHANILENMRAIGEALGIGAGDVGVSWLPLYHDMGLIGLWLGSLYFGAPAALMSPLAFLSRPARWLWAIHAHRGTISAAPNFAFDLCARRIPDDELAGLDLSSWRVAINGSEAVRADTIERFLHRFAPYGFRAEAMRPAYGLAESSVALTFSPAGRPPRIDEVDRERFERAHEARPAGAGGPALRFVSCGVPLPRHAIRVVDRAGRPLEDRLEGRIQFRGPSVTRGYFQNPDATRAVMHDGWMDSGDLGYVADGELFVTGREKDLIIRGGRNLSAEEIEAITSTVPGIRAHCTAAFGVPDPATGSERLVVVAETRERDPGRREALERAVRDRLVTALGAPPDVVVIAGPRTVLKTSSGKIRRSATREAYLSGTLGSTRSVVAARLQLAGRAGAILLRRAGDLLGRAAFTGWIALVALATAPALWAYLALRGPGPHANRAARLWARVGLALCGLRPRIVGLEHLRDAGSAVLVANHASYLDPIVLMAAIPGDFHFAAKAGLTRYPLIGAVIRKAGHIAIEKTALSDRLAGADEVAARLQRGDRLVIFPEGTFARAPRLLPFRLGAFRAAVEAQRPVVPLAIVGTRRVLPDGARLFRRAPVTVVVGPPMPPRGSGWPEMVRLRDAAVEFIERATGESRS